MPDPVRDFLMDASGDLAVVAGDFAKVSGQPAVVQGVACALRHFLGECYLDQTLGVDWINSILIKSPSPLVVRALLAAAIMRQADVVEQVGQQLSLSDDDPRRAQIFYAVRSVYSTAPIEESVTLPGGL